MNRLEKRVFDIEEQRVKRSWIIILNEENIDHEILIQEHLVE